MMPLVQSDPTSMFRGAIQHRIPADSSAIDLSLLEWLIKTLGSIPMHEPCSRFSRQLRDGTVAATIKICREGPPSRCERLTLLRTLATTNCNFQEPLPRGNPGHEPS